MLSSGRKPYFERHTPDREVTLLLNVVSSLLCRHLLNWNNIFKPEVV